MDAEQRFLAFERTLLERISTRTELLPWGTAYFDEDYRDRFITSFVFVDRPAPTVEAAEVIETTDRVLDGAGFAHRMLLVQSDADGVRWAPALAAAGYEANPSVMMELRRPPDRPADLLAEASTYAETRPLTEELYRREDGIPDRLVGPFADQHEKWERAIPGRRFVVRIDGTLAGQCELYLIGDVAQVEFVDTLEEFRGRGVARAVILGAIAAAHASGAAHVYIQADENDWPKDLYQRLGFDPYTRRWEFMRGPATPR